MNCLAFDSIECNNDDDDSVIPKAKKMDEEDMAAEYYVELPDEKFEIICNFMHKMILCSDGFPTVHYIWLVD